MPSTRRDFLKVAALAGASTLLPAGALAAEGAGSLVEAEGGDHRDLMGKLAAPPPQPDEDPNVRQAEVLWLFLVPDGARGYKYDPEHCHVVFDGRDLPVDKPWWSPTPWSKLLPGDVFRVREPDGELNLAGEHTVCLVSGYPEQIEGVWGVQVEPLRSIDVVFKAGGQHCVRGYSVGVGVGVNPGGRA